MGLSKCTGGLIIPFCQCTLVRVAFVAPMAALVGHDARQYSWWWVSHISPKNSKWLQENLNGRHPSLLPAGAPMSLKSLHGFAGVE
ncbi:hypothetical protein DAI22_03g003900 [Oryza sativa Japonica Group]|nr:hypothetical protein DAI22_03g003900 [Oryza sativa Japonica Group]